MTTPQNTKALLSAEFLRQLNTSESNAKDGEGNHNRIPRTSAQHLRVTSVLANLFADTKPLYLFVDASEEMGFSGVPGVRPTKFDFARQAAAAVGYAGLRQGQRICVAGLGQTQGRRVPVLQGPDSALALLSYWEGLRGGGNHGFLPALRQHVRRASAPGVCVVMSDFLNPRWEQAIRVLLTRQFDVVLLQIVDPAECDSHPLALQWGSDQGTFRPVDVTPGVAVRCQRAFEIFCRQIAAYAQQTGMTYARVSTDAPIERLVLEALHFSPKTTQHSR